MLNIINQLVSRPPIAEKLMCEMHPHGVEDTDTNVKIIDTADKPLKQFIRVDIG